LAGIAEVAADLSFLGYSTLATATDKAGITLAEFGKTVARAGKHLPACHCAGLAPSAARTASHTAANSARRNACNLSH
jgi:hypothetical protein